jgi:nitrous oxidase accessory protein
MFGRRRLPTLCMALVLLGATGLRGSGAAPASDAVPALQPLIDATPAGGTLRLAPGRYRGPAVVERAMTLDGAGQATVEGDRNSTVLVVRADGVTLRGLRLRGSGDSQDRTDAGIQLEGRGHRVEDNELDDVLFGLHLKAVEHSVVRGNRVRGKDLETGLRGDALRLWNSRHNRIEDNRFERGRDLTLMNSPDNRLVGNRFEDGRYGLHVVFSPRLLAEGNALVSTGTGIVVLYSPQVRIVHNRVAHALTAGGAGIVVKESDAAELAGNELLHCAVGLKLDAPVPGAGAVQVRDNVFAHNVVGLFFYGEAGEGGFAGNRFFGNLTTVALSAPGAGSAYRWQENRWDDYAGFDRNRDGIGDTPHEVRSEERRVGKEGRRLCRSRWSPYH